jgi:hypothetical protein
MYDRCRHLVAEHAHVIQQVQGKCLNIFTTPTISVFYNIVMEPE